MLGSISTEKLPASHPLSVSTGSNVTSAGTDETTTHIVAFPVGVAAVVVDSTDTTTAGMVLILDIAPPNPMDQKTAVGAIYRRSVIVGIAASAADVAVGHTGTALSKRLGQPCNRWR